MSGCPPWKKGCRLYSGAARPPYEYGEACTIGGPLAGVPYALMTLRMGGPPATNLLSEGGYLDHGRLGPSATCLMCNGSLYGLASENPAAAGSRGSVDQKAAISARSPPFHSLVRNAGHCLHTASSPPSLLTVDVEPQGLRRRDVERFTKLESMTS